MGLTGEAIKSTSTERGAETGAILTLLSWTFLGGFEEVWGTQGEEASGEGSGDRDRPLLFDDDAPIVVNIEIKGEEIWEEIPN